MLWKNSESFALSNTANYSINVLVKDEAILETFTNSANNVFNSNQNGLEQFDDIAVLNSKSFYRCIVRGRNSVSPKPSLVSQDHDDKLVSEAQAIPRHLEAASKHTFCGICQLWGKQRMSALRKSKCRSSEPPTDGVTICAAACTAQSCC